MRNSTPSFMPTVLRNRDAIALYRFEKQTNGMFVLSWVSDAKKDDPSEGVRMAMEGEVIVHPLPDGRSRVQYTYLGDVGGNFSESIKEAAWKTEPLHYFRALRNELTKR